MLIAHLKMAGQVFFVECVIVNFYFGEGSEVVWHEHDWNQRIKLSKNISWTGVQNLNSA